MTRIAIVGAGQAGLLAAHALRLADYEVRLFSDKSPQDFLDRARPTGTAGRFDMALSFERELGLDLWEEQAPSIGHVHLTFCPKVGNQLLTLVGRFEPPFLAIDLRLQSATWMRMLEERGGHVSIEEVDLERLDQIAAGHDLTIVAAGRGDLRGLFPRDGGRSTYSRPQRQLAMVNVKGPPMELPYGPGRTAIKFNFFAPHGEMFWVPWLSKDLEHCWSLLFEGKDGGPIDRFRGLTSAEAVLDRGLEVMRELTPWDAEWVEGAEPCDENAWLVGTFTPEVRDVVGTLPSGRHVVALGDTAQSIDPIAGQGANNGNKMARHLVASIVDRGEGPFDPEWMRTTFDSFWERHRYIDQFTNALLEPLTPAGQDLLIAQYGSDGSGDSPRQRLANAFCDNFNDPRLLTPALFDRRQAREVIAQTFGTSWRPLLRGRAAILRGQVRQKLGLPAGHPWTRSRAGTR